MWKTTQLTDSLKSFYTQSLEQAEQIGDKLGERATELTERFDVRDHADKLTEKLGIRENAAALAERVSEKLPPESKIVIASKKVLEWAESQTSTRRGADHDGAVEEKSASTKKPAAKDAGKDAAKKKPATKKASAAASKSAPKKSTAKTAAKSASKRTAEVTQVVAADGDTWVVKRSDSDHVTYRTESKEAAVTRASRIAQNNDRKLVVIEDSATQK